MFWSCTTASLQRKRLSPQLQPHEPRQRKARARAKNLMRENLALL